MSNEGAATRRSNRFFYGWVIVVAATLILFVQYGMIYSFGIFFKPLVADFGWSRGATSLVYSVMLLTQAFSGVIMGWLADRFGPAKIMVTCGILVGLGLMLSSRISALWQFYLAYGLIVGIGISGAYPIGTGTTARWFDKRRGLALGIVATGIGLGTLLMVPVIERIISGTGWSRAFLVLGVATWSIMIPGALLLRRPPDVIKELTPSDNEGKTKQIAAKPDITLASAIHTRALWMLIIIYFLFNFSVQMVMIHLVNYTTDQGMSPLTAATIVSVVGIGSILGRLGMGAASDKIGGRNALTLCCMVLAVSLLWLLFARDLWTFYLFAIIFGFVYGGEMSLLPAIIGQFFGFLAVSALVAAVVTGAASGGATGAWVTGQLFDVTKSYQLPFVIGIITSLATVILMLVLKKQEKHA